MFVGEIGFPRKEYLYELTFCEILLISRGYFRRFHPGWEQARMIAHQVHYCMGVPKGEMAKTPSEWVPFPWESEPSTSILPTEEDVAELQELMKSMKSKP